MFRLLLFILFHIIMEFKSSKVSFCCHSVYIKWWMAAISSNSSAHAGVFLASVCPRQRGKVSQLDNSHHHPPSALRHSRWRMVKHLFPSTKCTGQNDSQWLLHAHGFSNTVVLSTYERLSHTKWGGKLAAALFLILCSIFLNFLLP